MCLKCAAFLTLNRMNDERPAEIQISGSELAGYCAREKAGEFVITGLSCVTGHNAWYILELRWPTEKQAELIP